MKNMQKVLVFSDIHLRSNGKKIIGLDPLERLKFALEHSLNKHPDSKHIIFTGDLAHDGDINSYRSLRKLTDEIPIPKTFMMGNHDQRDVFLQVFPHLGLDPNGFFQFRISINSYELLFLDTLNKIHSLAEKHSGFLCSRRLAWLDERLRLSTKKVVIFMHHPAFSVGFKAMDKIKLANSRDFFEVLKKYKNVIHIVSGHVHRTISGYSQGYGFSIFKSTCHQMPMQCDSDTVQLSARERGAYGILFLKPDGLIVHTEDFGPTVEGNKLFDSYS